MKVNAGQRFFSLIVPLLNVFCTFISFNMSTFPFGIGFSDPQFLNRHRYTQRKRDDDGRKQFHVICAHTELQYNRTNQEIDNRTYNGRSQLASKERSRPISTSPITIAARPITMAPVPLLISPYF